MPLTRKRQRFVDEYLVDLNATQAAIRAGYSVTRASVTASELVRNRSVAEAIAAGTRAIQERIHVTADDISAVAWKIATDEATQAGPRVSALALLAKRHPEFSDKRDVHVTEHSEQLVALAQMPIEQLKRLAEGAKREGQIEGEGFRPEVVAAIQEANNYVKNEGDNASLDP